MNLYIFPEIANSLNGYSIAVKDAYTRLKPKDEDMVIWYSSQSPNKNVCNRPNDIFIKRIPLLSAKSAKNILLNRVPSELTASDLAFLRGKDFEEIHCDEVIFYRALRELFPSKKITVRFHNCFTRIRTRNEIIKQKIGIKYASLLISMKSLETAIFRDNNTYKVFLTDEDRNYYTSMTGKYKDSEVWQIKPNYELLRKNKHHRNLNTKLVWYGGVEAHKISSIEWFINEVLPEVKKKFPEIEFHLWGKNTLRFNNTEKGVYAHGFYDGDGFPLENSLYVNPDIIGGGIKVKLSNLLENGITFITTPFGFEGYSKDLIDNDNCFVVQEQEWVDNIISILQRDK